MELFHDALEDVEDFYDALDYFQPAPQSAYGRSQTVGVGGMADSVPYDGRSHATGEHLHTVSYEESDKIIPNIIGRRQPNREMIKSTDDDVYDQTRWLEYPTVYEGDTGYEEYADNTVQSGVTVNHGENQPIIKMMNTERENTYYVKGRFDRDSHMLLLDTGCSHSVMPYQLYTALSMKCKINYNPIHNRGVLADGSDVAIHGIAETQFKIGSKTYLHHFQLANIDGKVLLGMDFFRKHRCVIDVHRYTVQIGDEVLDCCDVNGDPLIIGVQARRTTLIPPQTQKIIEARMTRQTDRPVEGIVEPRHQIVGLMVATSLHCPHGANLNIRVLNATEEELIIREGTVIGQFVPVDEVETTLQTTEQFRTCQIAKPADLGLPSHLQEHADQWSKNLNPDEWQQVAQLLRDYADVFSKNECDVGRTDLVKHHIPLIPGTSAIKLNPYRQGFEKEKEIESQVQKLRELDLIEEGRGAFSFPVVLVKKKDGTWRFCVDYRKLNAVTLKDAYPLPRVDDSLDALGGSKWFSTLDMTSGYWQISMDEQAKERSAFVTRSGLWQWKVLPFGLTSAPSTFERLMETVMRGLQWETLLIYLDDIIIFSKDVPTHIARLATVLQRLKEAGLKLKPGKCNLFTQEVEYLGHIVSSEGVATDPKKIEAVVNWPIPQHQPDVRAFIGTCSYYRKFVPGYTELAKPLHKAAAKGANFKWTGECQVAFEKLKEVLTQSPILVYPEPGQPYILDTDASDTGSGAVLSQLREGLEKVIAYFSKTFSKEERNYCVTRREMLAIVRAVKNFHPYLYGQKVTVRTDHSSLTWLFQIKEPKGQLARWLEILTQYDLTLEHRRGLKHGNADGLSRQCCKDCKQCDKMRGDNTNTEDYTPVPAIKCQLTDGNAQIPIRATCEAAGLDLFSPIDATVKAKDRFILDTCIKVQLPEGCYGRVAPRSSLAARYGLDIGAGVIDPDYRGSIKLVIFNFGEQDYQIKQGERVAQLICETIVKPEIQQVDALLPTDRNDGGFGSTNTPSGQNVRLSVLQNLSQLARQQMTDPDISPVYQATQRKTCLQEVDVSEQSADTKRLVKMMEHLSIRNDGVLIARIPVKNRRRDVAICPREMRQQIIDETHRIAHLGINKTMDRIKLDWYWPGLSADTRRYVTACNRCQQSKASKHKTAGETHHLYAGRPFQILAIDLCGPFPKTPRGSTQILVMTDHFTRWCDAIPIQDGTTEVIAKVLDERVFSYLGVPEEIHSDQGRQFESKLFSELCKIWGSDKTRTSPYRPQANSVVERLNRTLGASLRALLIDLPQTDWDLMLPQIMRGIRSTPHRVTGETPNFLMLGRETKLPGALVLGTPSHEEPTVTDYAIGLKDRMTDAGDRLRAQQYDIRQEESGEPSLFMVGDLVWLKSFHKKKGVNPKLSPKYQGPYEIVEVLAYHTYRVRRDGKDSIQHEGRIKLHVEGTDPTKPQDFPASTVTNTITEPIGSIDELLKRSTEWQQQSEESAKPKHTTSRNTKIELGSDSNSFVSVTSKDKGNKDPTYQSQVMQTNGTEQGDRNRSDTQNKNQNAHAAEESEKEGSNNNNNVHTHPDISMLLENSRMTTDETLKAEPRSPSVPMVDLSGYECSYMPDDTNSSSPSNNQTAIKENETTTTELRRSKRIHGAPHKLTDYVVEINRLNSEI